MEVEAVEWEHQPALDGFESHYAEQPVGDIDTPLNETVAPGLSEVLADPTEESLCAEGNEPLDDGRETQKGDVQAAYNDGYADSEATGQEDLGTDVGEEYPTSAWAELSPDMGPEQLRLLDEDVERRGIIDPPDVLDGQVVDGRKREEARKRSGMPTSLQCPPGGNQRCAAPVVETWAEGAL